MDCIIVETESKAGARQRFLDAMLRNAQASARDQPGCFPLCQIHESQAALEDHKQTAHCKACRAVVTGLIECRTVRRSDVMAINPSR